MAVPEGLLNTLGNQVWRLNHLYEVEDEYGQIVPFKPRIAQQDLIENLHSLNLILKARQLGFSTLIGLFGLDCCLFNSNFSFGIVADTRDNSAALLGRIKNSFDRLPDEVRSAFTVEKSNASEFELSNGSSIRAGSSLRSGTYNMVHISEYGKICAKQPDKAKEIKSGALNTIAPGQYGFIESTAEGREGDFYDKSQIAKAAHETGRELGSLEYKFHFYPWHFDPKYASNDPLKATPETLDYFEALEANEGITLTTRQKSWYAAKSVEQGDDMWKEFPSTPEEAFKAALDGAYFGKQIIALRKLGRISTGTFDPRVPVNTFWDVGISDYTSIWLHQRILDRNRFVGFIEDNNEPLAYYIRKLNEWITVRGGVWGDHYGPHDIEHKRWGKTDIKSLKEMAADMQWPFETVERTASLPSSIENARQMLMTCEFDEDECEAGLKRLENYSKEWDQARGCWKSTERHDENSHGAAAFRTFADGYSEGPPTEPDTSELERMLSQAGGSFMAG